MRIKTKKTKDKDGKEVEISIFYDEENVKELGNLYENYLKKRKPLSYAHNINDLKELQIIDKHNERYFSFIENFNIKIFLIKSQKTLNKVLDELYKLKGIRLKLQIVRRTKKHQIIIRGFCFANFVFVFPTFFDDLNDFKNIIEHETLHSYFYLTRINNKLSVNVYNVFNKIVSQIPSEVVEVSNDLKVITKYYHENRLEELIVRYFTKKDFYQLIRKFVDLRLYLQPLLLKAKFPKSVNKRKFISAFLILLNRFEEPTQKLKQIIKELKSLSMFV